MKGFKRFVFVFLVILMLAAPLVLAVNSIGASASCSKGGVCSTPNPNATMKPPSLVTPFSTYNAIKATSTPPVWPTEPPPNKTK